MEAEKIRSKFLISADKSFRSTRCSLAFPRFPAQLARKKSAADTDCVDVSPSSDLRETAIGIENGLNE